MKNNLVSVPTTYIISAFVLTLPWFETKKSSEITGAIFKKYLRQTITILFVYMLYYFCIKMEITDQNPYIMKKSFWNTIEDATVGIHFLRVDFSACMWN